MSASYMKLNNCLVAFFDVIGFSKRLQTIDMESLYSEYAALLDKVNSTVFEQHETVAAYAGRAEQVRPANNFALTQIVSDSIILVSHDINDIGAVSRFVMASVLLMEECFTAQFPLRGTIAISDVLVDKTRSILLSPVIPALLAAEHIQEWSGCYILESSEQLVANALCGTRFVQQGMPEKARLPIIRYAVPTKDPTMGTGTRLCLNWPYLLDCDQLTKGTAFLGGRKRDETVQFIRHIFNLPNQAQQLPPECSPACSVRYRVTRSQFMARFFDADGRHEPSPGRPISWKAYEE